MKTTSLHALELTVLLGCAVVTGALATCVGSGDRSVEERTRSVPLVVKGIVVARSQTGHPRTYTIRVGKVLKGVNESVARVHIDIAILESQSGTTVTTSTTPTTTARLTNNATVTVRTTTTDGQGIAEVTTTEGGHSNTMATPCMDGLNILDRYIFFLRPLNDGRTFFEVVEDGVPQTRENLRRIRQTVKEEEEAANDTLPQDDHTVPCTVPVYVNHFCINNGTCQRWINLNKRSCVCEYPYYGERCEHIDPALSTGEEPVVINDTTLVIAVIMSALLIVTVICFIGYIKYKNSVWRERKREIEKTVKYFQQRYPSHPSRRDSPIEGVVRLNQNSSSNNGEGGSHVIIFQEAEGRSSRQGSLSSNQYRLLTEVLAHNQPHRASADFTEHVPHRDSARSSIV